MIWKTILTLLAVCYSFLIRTFPANSLLLALALSSARFTSRVLNKIAVEHCLWLESYLLNVDLISQSEARRKYEYTCEDAGMLVKGFRTVFASEALLTWDFSSQAGASLCLHQGAKLSLASLHLGQSSKCSSRATCCQ